MIILPAHCRTIHKVSMLLSITHILSLCSLQTRQHLRVSQGLKVPPQVVVVLKSQYVFCVHTKIHNTTDFTKNWSSAESFPSSASNNFASSFEQCRSLNFQLNEIKLENAELIKNNRILSAKLDTLACVFDNYFNFLAHLLLAQFTRSI